MNFDTTEPKIPKLPFNAFTRSSRKSDASLCLCVCVRVQKPENLKAHVSYVVELCDQLRMSNGGILA